jgi:hypothetical protein
MGFFSKKKNPPATIVVTTTIIKGRSEYDSYDEFTVIVEGGGFTGQGKGMSIATAFKDAYEDLMSHMASTVLSK